MSGAPSSSDPPALYFASDYGTGDEFVGVVHAVLHRRAPGIEVVDLSHDLPPFDVAAGADLLVRCAPVLGPGVVLGIVDPGVGSDRRAVAIATPALAECREGRSDDTRPAWLVGPDNGLLLPLAAACGGARRAHLIDRDAAVRRGWPAVEGARTFDGRDLFAPAAAHLVRGQPAEELGPELDPDTLEGRPQRAATGAGPAGTGVAATVNWIDRFGNVQLDLVPEDLASLAPRVDAEIEVEVEVRSRGDTGPGRPEGERHPSRLVRRARRVETFAALATGELGLLIDANGRVALVCGRSSAAEHLGRPGRGDRVQLTPGPGP